MRFRRFSDIPLLFKVGFPPAFAVLALLGVASATLWSQQRQTLVLAGVIGDNTLQSRIAMDAQRITAANGALYAILTRQAAGAPIAVAQAQLQALQQQVEAVQENLQELRPDLSPGPRRSFDEVWQDIEDYQEAIKVVGAMLGVDFNTAAAFIQPFQANYARMTATLNGAARQVAAESLQNARQSTHQARLLALLTLIFSTCTLLIVAAVAWVIVLSVKRTVTDISQATEKLAQGQNALDLERLARADEFGAIVRSLTVFRENQFKIVALRQEREALQVQQEATRIEQERLVRMITVLSESNEAILRAETREKLFSLVCEAAALGGQFTYTNILLSKPGEKYLQVVAAAGPSAAISMAAPPATQGTRDAEAEQAEKAFHSRMPSISNDYLTEERSSAFYEMTRSTGTKSSAALPLVSRGQAVGCMLFMSAEENAFTPDFVTILQRIAGNVSFALENFDHAEEREKAEARIKYLANHDSLTNLANRAAFNQLLSFSIKNARRYERKCAILFIDLDRFKLINDSLGHAAGDALLIEMAKRLRSVVRSSDVVARLGGDEFMILLNEIAGRQQAEAVAHHLLSTFSAPMVLSGHECRVTASIGIAMFPDDGEDEQTLMKNADIAMYYAKGEGKNDVRFFSAEIKTQSIDRLKIESSLQHAVERNEFCLHYQPKLDVITGKIAGVEALLRWTHPELGLLPPMQFIPLAEETGLIVMIGKWVLNTACVQNMAWQRAGLPPVSMAINVSPRQFSDMNLLQDIDDALALSGMDPKYLQIEITESMVMLNIERTIRVLDAIQSRGVRLAIDDFGTGYSSMSMLKRFPIDTIKIDRSFVRDLPENSEDKAIAQAIISMGKALGLTIVAEGVETREQDAFLRAHACDEIQGYLFSRPLLPESITELLEIAQAAPPSVPPEPYTSTVAQSENAPA
jgi:diguanylate cyclase (GGDEF)-like protein